MPIGSHQSPRALSVEWFTPPEILEKLGPFDDDPCLPGKTDGLHRAWRGFVWLNPPYGRYVWQWMYKLADHGNGIGIVFARTETRGFFESVWGRADALLFIKGRLRFLRADGRPVKGNAGAPSVLVGYGEKAVKRLRECGIEGALVEGWECGNESRPYQDGH